MSASGELERGSISAFIPGFELSNPSIQSLVRLSISGAAVTLTLFRLFGESSFLFFCPVVTPVCISIRKAVKSNNFFILAILFLFGKMVRTAVVN
jgi:hypothetical protein